MWCSWQWSLQSWALLRCLGFCQATCPQLCHRPLPHWGCFSSCCFFGSVEKAPVQLDVLQEPLAFLAPSDPMKCLLCVAVGCVAVTLAHGWSVLQHLAKNSKGVYMPHSLKFGSWELRALPFVALPAAAASTTLVRRGLISYFCVVGELAGDEADLPNPLLDLAIGMVVLIGLLGTAIGVWIQVHGMFVDDLVLSVQLPGGEGTIFVDRISDELRAMPVGAGASAVFGGWTTTPGWCIGPALSSIFELEYQGLPERGHDHGSWEAVWPEGPWEPSRGAKRQSSTDSLEGAMRPSYSAGRLSMSNSGSRLSSSGSRLQEGMNRTSSVGSTAGDEAGGKFRDGLGPVAGNHKITAQIRFPYKCSNQLVIAGVSCMPWIDVAFPGTSLRLLWASDPEGEFKFSVHVGQLSGPLTSGRLGACFEWGDRCPYRWPLDILAKVLLGLYIGAWPYLADDNSMWGFALHVLAVICPLVFAILVLKYRPHSTLLDNLSLAAACAAVSLTTASAQYYYKGGHPAATIGLTVTLMVLTAVPLFVLAAASALVASFALRFSRQDMQKALVTTIPKWGRDKDSNRERKATNVKVLPIKDGKVAMALPLELPASTSSIPMHVEIKLPAAPAGVKATLVQGEKTIMPIPADLLLLPPDHRTYEMKTQRPVGAVMTQQGGVLLYPAPEHNGGQHWREAVRAFLGPKSPEVLKEAIAAIQEQGKRFGDLTFTTVDIKG
mmetsp:Transcript_20541/g.66535  ORF Transcript_20541/g.66535 Transcript_20541/m.66535 type:complete len:721 (-) Transcript_20541:247-2409(-)